MKKSSTRSSAFTTTSQGDQGFWPSYADMMSAVALILFFLMLLAYIQNLITGNDLEKTKSMLEDTRSQLISTKAEVIQAEQELNAITLTLDAAREEMEQQNLTILDQLTDIELQQSTINAQKQTLEEQQATIDAQKVQAFQQEQYLISTQKEITQLRTQMQTIAVLRLSILEQIRDSLASVMGDANKVSIGSNGSIILSSSILFDSGSSVVKQNSALLLNQLASVFTKFLADNENARYVDSIVISGHTDSDGNDESNRKLSTDRAHSVLTYLLDANGSELASYAQYFCAAGYGESRPVADNSTDAGKEANRRIELSIILKDETVMEIVEQYLSIEPPVG